MRGMLNKNQLINVFIGLLPSFLIVPAAISAEDRPMSKSKLHENCRKSVAIFVGEIVKMDLPPQGAVAKKAILARISYKITDQLKGHIKPPKVDVCYCMASGLSFCNPDTSEIKLQSFKLHKKLLVFCTEPLQDQDAYLSRVSVPTSDELVADVAVIIRWKSHK